MATKLIGERLPQNWSYAVTKDGRIFFVDDSSRWTTWLHPVTREPVQTGFSSVQGLPAGWEQALSIDGTIYFIDHTRRITTFCHPLTGHSVMEGHVTASLKFTVGKGNQNRKSSKPHVKPPTTAREETSHVIMKGWLQKQESGGLKLWKKKWCVLADFGLFFYKDKSEQSCTGSILLPGFTISPCGAHDVNKKFAFKAEHKNLKTLYFCAEKQSEMEKWVQTLQMSALVQRAHGSDHVPEVIPKSSIMNRDDDIGNSRDFACQYQSSNSYETTPRSVKHIDDSFRERSPLQSKENSQNSSYHYSKQFDGNRSGEPIFNVGSFPMEDRDQEARQAKHFNSIYFADVNNREGESLRINQGQQLPNDQWSLSSSSQFSSTTLPRDVRIGDSSDNKGQDSFQGQTYHSLPRHSRFIPGGVTESHFVMRQTDEHEGCGRLQANGSWDRVPVDERKHLNKRENSFVTMTISQQMDDRRMDSMKHSRRPFAHDTPSQPMHAQVQTGDGDYASLTRTRNKWPNQKLSDSDASGPASLAKSNLSQTQQQPDLYINIPHTYVNVSDESQFRGVAQNLPMRPPLPIEIRHRIVEDIAKAHSPNTQRDMLIAEDNLEKRMQQPPFFIYPTPTRESLPSFPQHSPTSHCSQQSRLQQEQDRQPQLPRKPDALILSGLAAKEDVANTYPAPSDCNMSNVSADYCNSNTTLTNDDDRNDKISEFYGLGKYNEKSKQYKNDKKDKNRFVSDIDVQNQALPSQPMSGYMTGEKDFCLRSMLKHVQSMPSLSIHQQTSENDLPNRQQQTFHNDIPNRQQQMFPNDMSNRQQQTIPNNTSIRQQQTFCNDMSNRQHEANTYMNISPSKKTNGLDLVNPNRRRSAFRSVASNSLQRISSVDGNFIKGYSSDTHNVDPSKQLEYNLEQMDDSLMSHPELLQNQDSLHIPAEHLGKSYSKTQGQKGSEMPDYNKTQGQKGSNMLDYIKTQGQKGSRMPQTIDTVKEDEDMPDSQVIVTELPPKVFPLNGPRLRMSISANDLLGKTHDELVLLLIQLQRDKADLTQQRDEIRKNVEQCRATEFYYRKFKENENQSIDVHRELQHRKYQEFKHKLEEAEKKLEVYKPLVNLIYNMVTMGSLYGGDNLMLATEYRKHLLSPEQYSQPKQMIEFSRRHQEELIVQEIEDDVKELTKEQVDLEEKLSRFGESEKIMQNQSFQVSSLKEDREMLENTLDELLKMQDHHCTNPRELDQFVQQQKIVEKELSRVLQQLAEASKELEETTAENNKLQHEVLLLRMKVHGNGMHSKSVPSLSGESLQTKMKMEKDLARVKNLMEGLSEEGAKLQEMMSSFRKPKSGTDEQKSFSKDCEKIDNKKQIGSTYFETDIDTNESKDLAMVAALLAAYQLLPSQSARELNPEPLSHRASVNTFRKPPSNTENGSSAFRIVSTREVTAVSQAPPVKVIQLWEPQPDLEASCGDQNDTGLFPRNVQKLQTVGDAVKQVEMWKKHEDDPPPLYVSLNPSDYPYSTYHVYENLPQQQSATVTIDKPPRVTILPEVIIPTSTTSRRSNMHLLTAKPFTLCNSKPIPFCSVNSSTSLYKSQKLDKVDAPMNDHNILLDQSQPFLSENSFESSQSKNSYKASEPITSQNSSKAPPPPPIRGTSKYYATNQQSLRDIFMNNVSNENYESSEPAILKKGKTNRNLQKARYVTISSSEPMKLEQSWPQSPQLHSQAGDLISSMEIPDIVKSSTTRSDIYDEKAIDREILFFPEKVNISERYIPDSDDEYNITEEERIHRLEKADKIKKILTNQSIHFLSQPDISNVAVAGEVHERAQQEKQKLAFLLGISQELAEQVKLKSREIAANRRKTWSGSLLKSEVNVPESYAANEDQQNSGEERYDDDRNLEDRSKNSSKDVNAYNNNNSQNFDISNYEHNKSLYGHNKSLYGHNTYTSRHLEGNSLYSRGGYY